ncbi:MAG: hypothetical protein JWO78_2124 [Micavibrio sp.]|nr:hypothetical protein [Micavibrio sp.]
MAIHGVFTDKVEKREKLIATLRTDDMERYTVVPSTVMINKWPDDLNWVIVDSTYPAQISRRMELLLNKRDMVVDRLPGDDVRAAEYELRDTVVNEVLTLYPDYFKREGDLILSPLTGLALDVGPYGADPLVTVALLASEDMLLLLPEKRGPRQETVYPLKAGALLFPNGWGLRSKFNQPEPVFPHLGLRAAWREAQKESLRAARLGKTPYEIHHGAVSHYMAEYATRVDTFFANMKPEHKAWRRNWGMTLGPELFRHSDHQEAEGPDMNAENWEKFGYLRSEHETFRKLPVTGAVIFGIKTYLWKLDALVRNEKALNALLAGNDNLKPLMFEYRSASLPSFREFLDRHRPKAVTPDPSVPGSLPQPTLGQRAFE